MNLIELTYPILLTSYHDKIKKARKTEPYHL